MCRDSEGLTVFLMYTGCLCSATPGSRAALPDQMATICTVHQRDTHGSMGSGNHSGDVNVKDV